MTGRHRKNLPLTAKIAGGLLAGTALATTFAVAADANTLPEASGSGKGVAVQSASLRTGLVLDGLTAHPGPGPDFGPGSGSGPDLGPGPGSGPDFAPGPDFGPGPGPDFGPGDQGPRPDFGRPDRPSQDGRPDDGGGMGKGASVDDFIDTAKSQVGTRENGSGETKFQDWYAKTDRAGETVARDGGSRSAYLDAQWCDMFVSWTAKETGLDHTVGQDAWTVAHAKWFKSHGRWGTTPRKGAIVFFNWNGDKSIDDIVHVGIVTGVDGGDIKTVEGNTDNAVLERTRSASQIVGYGYPEFSR